MAILVVFEFRKFRKKLILTFILTHFQLTRKRFSIIYGKFDLFIKLFSFNDSFEI